MTLIDGRRHARDMDFREYTPKELADALTRAGEGLDVVDLELQAADGAVLHSGVMRMHVGHGHDFDRTGGYTWARITARLEA